MTTHTGPARLDSAALLALDENGEAPRLLDVRTPGEFRTAHIPGSYNVPLDTLREPRDGGVLAWEAAGGALTRGPQRWDLERQVRLVAGSVVLTTEVAGLFLPGLHLIGTAVGAGLTVAAVTGTCALGMLLSKLPYDRGPRTDRDTVLAAPRSTP